MRRSHNGRLRRRLYFLKETAMRILVQKFGGTSVSDIDRLKMVRGKVCAELDKGYKPISKGLLLRIKLPSGGHCSPERELTVQRSEAYLAKL